MTAAQAWSILLAVVCLILLGMWLAGVDAELRAMKGLEPRQMPEPEPEQSKEIA